MAQSDQEASGQEFLAQSPEASKESGLNMVAAEYALVFFFIAVVAALLECEKRRGHALRLRELELEARVLDARALPVSEIDATLKVQQEKTRQIDKQIRLQVEMTNTEVQAAKTETLRLKLAEADRKQET